MLADDPGGQQAAGGVEAEASPAPVSAPDESEKLVGGLGGLLQGQQSSHQRAVGLTTPSGHTGHAGRADAGADRPADLLWRLALLLDA
ncbi:MAG: hypothetical protein JO352_05545 [Chloroflexi bacterium]|nr:hypothetical protein [Chloroflexota bacterium]